MRAVRRAARLVGGDCLAQSIALTAALARANADPTMVLGCRRYGEREWGAHAWVVVDGEVFEPLRAGAHHALAGLGAGTQWVPAPITQVGGFRK
jgi:hypothetical protein